MADLTWEGKTKEMYDKLIANTPAPFRKMSEKNLTAAIEKNAESGKVTQDVIVDSVKEVTPKPFVKMALKSIDDLLG